MDIQTLLTFAPFVACLACSVGVYFSAKKSCDGSIGKLKGIGKVCGSKFSFYVSLCSALLCGSFVMMLVRTVLGQ